MLHPHLEFTSSPFPKKPQTPTPHVHPLPKHPHSTPTSLTGNLIRTPDGKIAILDFGLMTVITPDQSLALTEYIAHLSVQDWEAVANDLVNLGFIPPGVDPRDARIIEPLGQILEQLSNGGGAAGVNIDVVTVELNKLSKQYPIKVVFLWGGGGGKIWLLGGGMWCIKPTHDTNTHHTLTTHPQHLQPTHNPHTTHSQHTHNTSTTDSPIFCPHPTCIFRYRGHCITS